MFIIMFTTSYDQHYLYLFILQVAIYTLYVTFMMEIIVNKYTCIKLLKA